MRGLKSELVEDIRRIAKARGQSKLSRSEYLSLGHFSEYQIYDGGHTWESYCKAAGVTTKKKEPVPEKVYFSRFASATKTLGRFPKSTERKEHGLNFSKRRYPTYKDFIAKAIKAGVVQKQPTFSHRRKSVARARPPQRVVSKRKKSTTPLGRPVPPIPEHTRRKKWERTGIEAFPYAPQDESGVVALFGILCHRGTIQWQILEMRHGKGIDVTCYDEDGQREIRVELKHTFRRSGWNHRIEDVDYVVCWENKWVDFPKPVIVLREILANLS